MSYSVGQQVTGVVSGVAPFGAFVSLPDGTSGMIHISKLSRDYVSDINSVIKKGDTVTATVISTSDGRIALSLVDLQYETRPARPVKNDFESMLSSFKSASDEKLSSLTKGRGNDRRKRR